MPSRSANPSRREIMRNNENAKCHNLPRSGTCSRDAQDTEGEMEASSAGRSPHRSGMDVVERRLHRFFGPASSVLWKALAARLRYFLCEERKASLRSRNPLRRFCKFFFWTRPFIGQGFYLAIHEGSHPKLSAHDSPKIFFMVAPAIQVISQQFIDFF
jgi:hypothetical protein